MGRGGEKLAAALARFDVVVDGIRALDAGSSTGGFTDALLQAGAVSVVAVDVGRAQLHERLRADDRVEVREQTDIRDVDVESLGAPVDMVVADLSFISLRSVIDALVGLVRPGGDVVVLVKPQFEAGRSEAAKGRGVIRDPQVWRRVLEESGDTIARAGAVIMDAMVSPIHGAEGNVEFLVHARVPSRPGDTAVIAASVGLDLDALVATAEGGG